ncbi:MAG: sucrase ferredoxin, partial [Actinomycetota bacterium]
MTGTASRVRSWILLEQPGPWGYDAPVQSRLSRGIAGALRDRARPAGIRIVLIRRPGRSSSRRRVCYFVHTGPAAQRLERVDLEAASELLDIDWSPLIVGEHVEGAEAASSAFLVCTNGARDRCCAERGRAVAAALAEAVGDRAWECSHIGGDRFAANLVCFPHGVYYGRVGADDAARLARL